MKITSVDVIKNGERDLMDAITAELDWGAVEEVFRERHNLGIEEDIEYKKGDIVVHDDHVAYRLDFVAKVALSVLLDRDGNYISIGVGGGAEKEAAGQENHDGRISKEDKDGYERVLSELGEEDQGIVPEPGSQESKSQ